MSDIDLRSLMARAAMDADGYRGTGGGAIDAAIRQNYERQADAILSALAAAGLAIVCGFDTTTAPHEVKP